MQTLQTEISNLTNCNKDQAKEIMDNLKPGSAVLAAPQSYSIASGG